KSRGAPLESTAPAAPAEQAAPAAQPQPALSAPTAAGRAVRVKAATLDRLLGLAGESVVAASTLDAFARSLLNLRQFHRDLGDSMDRIREAVAARGDADGAVQQHVVDAQLKIAQCNYELLERM